MIETFTTEQVMLLSGDSRLEVYKNALRYGWSVGISKPSHKHKLYDAAKVTKYLQAQAITQQAQRLLGYGKHGRLLWPVAQCPECHKAASYIKGMSILCIDGHYTEG